MCLLEYHHVWFCGDCFPELSVGGGKKSIFSIYFFLMASYQNKISCWKYLWRVWLDEYIQEKCNWRQYFYRHSNKILESVLIFEKMKAQKNAFQGWKQYDPVKCSVTFKKEKKIVMNRLSYPINIIFIQAVPQKGVH